MKLKGLWMLVRIIPVSSWSLSAILLGTSIVVSDIGWREVNRFHLILIVLSAFLLQGIIAHAFNDLKDWESGTDLYSPGILSGGSGVIRELFFDQEELTTLARCSILLVIMIAFYFVLILGLSVAIFCIIGLFAAIAYSCPPLRLAYRPWAGEWFCAWPAMVACTAGTSYVLSGGGWYLESFILGMLHATFCITWLMLHHIPDVEADLRAKPVKWTTVAYLKKKRGWSGVIWILKTYLLATLVFAFLTGILLKRLEIFTLSGVLIALTLYWIGHTSWDTVEAVTRTELLTIGMTVINVLGIAWVLMA